MMKGTPLPSHADASARRLSLVAILLLLIGCRSSPSVTDAEELDQMWQQQERRQQEADALYEQAKAALAKGKMDQAQTHLERAVELNPYHGAAHNDLGAIYYRNGNLHQAALAFDVARRNLPGKHEPLYNLGLVWETAGRLKDAAEAYNDALRLAPEDVTIMENLARVYIRMGTNQRETIRLLQEALIRERRPQWKQWINMQLLRLNNASDLAPGNAAPAEH